MWGEEREAMLDRRRTAGILLALRDRLTDHRVHDSVAALRPRAGVRKKELDEAVIARIDGAHANLIATIDAALEEVQRG